MSDKPQTTKNEETLNGEPTAKRAVSLDEFVRPQTTLKPCPFCGTEVRFGKWGRVQHPTNECLLSDFNFNGATTVFEDGNKAELERQAV
jgi:hypothetical protein